MFEDFFCPVSSYCMYFQIYLTRPSLQAMTDDSDLNMGNNIGKRDTQFFGMVWLKTLEN